MIAVLTILALVVGVLDGVLTLSIAVRQRYDENVERRHWENQVRFDEVTTRLEQLQTSELSELLDLLKRPPQFITDSEGRTYAVVRNQPTRQIFEVD